MKHDNYIAICDLEIGDKVKIIDYGYITQVSDIRFIHYARSKNTEVHFLLYNPVVDRMEGWFERDQFAMCYEDDLMIHE